MHDPAALTTPLHDPAAHADVTRGSLAKTPLPALLVSAIDRKLSGSFVFAGRCGDRSAVVVQHGLVTKIRTAKSVEPLGRLLVDVGAIAPSTLDRGLSAATRQHSRLGEALLALDLLESSALEAALCEQLTRRLAWVGQLPPNSEFGYYAGVDFLRDRAPQSVDPLTLIWRCIEKSETSEQQQALLGDLMNRCLALHPEACPDRFGLTRLEQCFVEALRDRPRTLGALLQCNLLDAATARRLVYALALTRQLALGGDTVPLQSERPAAPDPQRTVSATRPAAAGRRAGPVSPPPLVERALARATRGARPGLQGSELRAAHKAFQNAEEHLAHNRLELAERLSQEACAAAPKNPQYLGLNAWIRAQRGALAHPAQAQQVMAALDRAVMKQRGNPTLHLYRARALDRLGQHQDAIREFRVVAQLQPDNIEANRQLRLHQMRSDKTHPKRRGLLARVLLR
jgi:tetratricopeptide (TPR) repeat protein